MTLQTQFSDSVSICGGGTVSASDLASQGNPTKADRKQTDNPLVFVFFGDFCYGFYHGKSPGFSLPFWGNIFLLFPTAEESLNRRNSNWPWKIFHHWSDGDGCFFELDEETNDEGKTYGFFPWVLHHGTIDFSSQRWHSSVQHFTEGTSETRRVVTVPNGGEKYGNT